MKDSLFNYFQRFLNHLCFGIFILSITSSCDHTAKEFPKTVDLSGTWSFQLDSANEGLKEKWFNKKFSDSVQLPGTTDENKKGILLDEKVIDRLSRVWYWKGAAWYQKEIDIPESWVGKHVELLLERTKDTHVWFDDIKCGYENTLSAPQYFDLTKAIKPGKHTLTVLVDNSKLPPVGPSHAVDERTQTNWNGIVGRIELQVSNPVWVQDLQVYPDVANNQVMIKVTTGNMSDIEVDGELLINAESWNTDNPMKFKAMEESLSGISNEKVFELTYVFDKDAPLWDEFDPSLIRLNLELSVNSGSEKFISTKQVDFGMREFRREGKYLLLNDKRIFLRGRLDCANYPLTGYPPMDKPAWLKLFRQLKSYGINHWRFHSWCPPEEAMQAADEVGVYLQPELPNKRSGMDKKSMEDEAVRKMYNIDYLEVDPSKVNMTLRDYLEKEGELIFKNFGNHPSFMMFTLGNELGRNEDMFELVAHFQDIDPRRLYAQGSSNMHWDPGFAKGDDFWVTATLPGKLGVRGSFATVSDVKKPHIENQPPSTLHTYTKAIQNIDVPIIAHETGQFQVYPDFRDIPKFTGVTRARNYEIFRDRLEKANMLDQAGDFVQASGKLATICYREDIEAALRTPDFAGFQLLDIQDFPGQGTALVGILNDFMESKGFVTPEKWNQFCSEVVPLLKMEKYTWTNDETFTGKVDIAHYGPDDFKQEKVNWIVTDESDVSYAKGILTKETIERGGLRPVGEVSFSLDNIKEAKKLRLTISIAGTEYTNEYEIWVYPKSLDTTVPEGVQLSDQLDLKTRKYLEAGGKVILFPDHDKLTNSIPGGFQSDFWSPMFIDIAIRRGAELPPGSLGFICDPDSPLFESFPTEFHSNWQWWHLVKNSKPIILDDTPADYKPMVQTIDNFARNHKLGMVFESKYGKGSILICAIDLPKILDKPAARQLYSSMLKYVKSDDFSPQKELNRDLLNRILQ